VLPDDGVFTTKHVGAF